MKHLSATTLAGHISQMPMLKVLVAVIAGILLAERFTLPLWSVVTTICLSLVLAWWGGRKSVADIYILATLFLMGALSVERHRRTIPSDEPLLYKIEVTALTSQSAGRVYGEGCIVGEYRNDSIISRNFPVRITADSSAHVVEGSLLTAFCRVQHFRPNENRYAHYMSQRGFVGQVWLSAKSIMYAEQQPLGPGQRLQQHAMERLARLHLPADVESIAAAITIGERLSLTPALRDNYRRSGASHLLAVSGLHVGYVVVVVNILLLFLLLLPHGQLLRGAFAIAIIWIYAAMVGFSPSVVRATAMFSIVQISLSLASYTISLNTLCMAAALMLLCNPFMLHDAGFLLSFLAVAGIVEWGTPLLRRLRQKPASRATKGRFAIVHRISGYLMQWLLTGVVVSIVASAITMPLVAWLFGLSSLWGILSSPVMVLLCGVAVGATLVWILLPLAPLAPLFYWTINLSTSAMNTIAAWCASQSPLIFEGYMDGGICGLIYLIYIALTLLLWSHKKSRS